ncbi:MAG: hypothetical protein ACYC6J_01250 [Coriobacteriia bacterium]
MAKRLTLALLVVALLLGVGCVRPGTPEGGPDGSDTGKPAVEGQLSAGDLPSEPGYAWDVGWYLDVEPLPVEMSVNGPWTFPSAVDWQVGTNEIVELEAVPEIEIFSGYDFVVRTEEFGEETYHPRQMTDEWMLQLGRISVSGDTVVAEPYAEPLRLWPLGFDVGDTFMVLEGENFRVDAKVVAQNRAVVPAGEIEDTYLVRFVYTPITEGSIEGTNYYLLAPGVGFVGMFSVAAGDEASGFTALDAASVLITLPERR